MAAKCRGCGCASSDSSPTENARCESFMLAHRRTSHKATRQPKARYLPTVRLTVSPPVAEFFCGAIIHHHYFRACMHACISNQPLRCARARAMIFLHFFKLFAYILRTVVACCNVLRSKANSMICSVILPLRSLGLLSPWWALLPLCPIYSYDLSPPSGLPQLTTPSRDVHLSLATQRRAEPCRCRYPARYNSRFLSYFFVLTLPL